MSRASYKLNLAGALPTYLIRTQLLVCLVSRDDPHAWLVIHEINCLRSRLDLVPSFEKVRFSVGY